MIKSVNLKQIQANNGVCVLVYGKSGSGKTSSIRNLPRDKTVIICSEPQGLQALVNFGWEDARVICPESAEQFLKAVNDVLEDDTAQHIVIDSLSQYSEMLMKEYIESSGKSPAKIGIDLYRAHNLLFQTMYRTLLTALPLGKDIIGIIHMNIKEETQGEERKLVREIALSGQLPTWISRLSAMVVRAERVRIGKETKYVFVYDPTNESDAKDLFGVVGASPVDNDIAALLAKIREKQPCPAPREKGTATGYAAILKLAAQHKIAHADVSKFLADQKISPKTATSEEWESALDAFQKQYIAF